MSKPKTDQAQLRSRWEAADPENPALRRQIAGHYDEQGTRYKFVEEAGQVLLDVRSSTPSG